MESTAPPSQAVAGTSVEGRTVAIVGYITIFGFLAAIFMHSSHKTQLGAFHLRQVLGIALTGLACGLLLAVPILGWIVWFLLGIGLFILWLLGLLSAIGGEMRPVPILGEHYQRWFAGVFG